MTLCSDSVGNPDVWIVPGIKHWIFCSSSAKVVKYKDEREEGDGDDDGEHDPVTERSPPLSRRLHHGPPPPDEPVGWRSPLVLVLLTVRVPGQQWRLGEVSQVPPVSSPHRLAVEGDHSVSSVPGRLLRHQLVCETERICGDVLALRRRSGSCWHLRRSPLQTVGEQRETQARSSPVDVLQDGAEFVRHRTDQIVRGEDAAATHRAEVTSRGRVGGQRPAVVVQTRPAEDTVTDQTNTLLASQETFNTTSVSFKPYSDSPSQKEQLGE